MEISVVPKLSQVSNNPCLIISTTTLVDLFRLHEQRALVPLPGNPPSSQVSGAIRTYVIVRATKHSTTELRSVKDGHGSVFSMEKIGTVRWWGLEEI
jgi:hypothetical protein